MLLPPLPLSSCHILNINILHTSLIPRLSYMGGGNLGTRLTIHMHLHYVTPSINYVRIVNSMRISLYLFKDLGRRLRDAESRAQQAQPELAAKDRELEVGRQLMFTAVSAVGSTKCGRCYKQHLVQWCNGALVHVLVHLCNVVYHGMLLSQFWCSVVHSNCQERYEKKMKRYQTCFSVMSS